MSIKNINVIKNGVSYTLDKVVYKATECSEVYARASENDTYILVFNNKGESEEMGKTIIAGNWKMNPQTIDDAVRIANELCLGMQDIDLTDKKVVIFPPSCFLETVCRVIKSHGAQNKISVGVQNIYFETHGAYTGEISASQVKSIGCEYVIIGHSERRIYFGETNEACNKKIQAALQQGLKVLYCVGEKLDEREANVTDEVIRMQLAGGLYNLSAEQAANLIIVYEPIWAIGTGKVATADQAQECCKTIREWIISHYSDETSNSIAICYGGSVKPSNAAELMRQTDIDGALVGGPSLTPTSFLNIITAS